MDSETHPERKPGHHRVVGGCRHFQVALWPREGERPSRSKARWGHVTLAVQCLAPLESSRGVCQPCGTLYFSGQVTSL